MNKAPTTTALAATPSPSPVGQAATLTATVTGYQPGGTITFGEMGSDSINASEARLVAREAQHWVTCIIDL